ncbi:MAG TPA: hypothetical protein VLB79_01235 [Solirubrobacterales bacterium]|nr:hypothetical protein [Solirubrobacterales bacterium]
MPKEHAHEELERRIDGLRLQLGWLQSREIHAARTLPESEFGVFSQWGEDGIIQFLTRRVPIENDVFVEIGVQDYRESNTRFLLEKDDWRGLIVDAGSAHLDFLARSELGWRHWIDAVSAFVDRENVNRLITAAGIEGDIGLLSIDIDGNDYWVLEAVEVVSPRILVVEYNSLFGPTAAITVPYRPDFERAEAHPSWLYFGASIAALAELARRKGYALVGGNRAGVNAFFIREDVLGDLQAVGPEQAYVRSRFRESRRPDGELSLVSEHVDRLALIADMPVVDVSTGRETTVLAAVGGR